MADSTVPEGAVGADVVKPTVPDGAVVADGSDSEALARVNAMTHGEGSLLQMTALAIPTVEEVLNDPILQEMAEEIESADYYHVFEVANAVAERYVLERIIPKLPPDKQKAARMVVSYVNYSNVPEGEKNPFLQLASAYQTVSRIMMTYMLGETDEQAEGRGFSILESTELKCDAELGGVMDKMFIKWQGMKHACSEEKREELGLTSRWHMTVEDGQGGFMEVPLQDFMPREYVEANFILDHLIDELKKLEDNPKIDQKLLALKLDYYIKLSKALDEKDNVSVHQVWETAERAFVRQGNASGNRVISTHSQEWGYAGNKSGIAPEMTVKVIVPNHPSDVLKAEALKDFREKLPSLIADMPKALKGIESLHANGVTTVYPAIQSGIQLDFESAGQNLPNNGRIKDEEGVVSNISPNVMIKRLREAGETLFIHFFPKDLLDKVDYNQVLADVAKHEMGHNIGDRSQFREGHDIAGCEEWKATGTEFALASLNAESLSDDQLVGFVVSQIAQAMRYVQKRKEESQYPYYLSFLSFMREAQKTGVLQNTEGSKWNLNTDRTALLGFINRVKNQWIEAEHIYENGDKAAMDAFVKQHFTDFIPHPDNMETADGSKIIDETSDEPMSSFMADVAQFIYRENKAA